MLPALPENVLAGAVPTWDLSSLVHRNCPICSSNRKLSFCTRPDSLNVTQCEDCLALYLPDIPSESEIIKFYEQYNQFKAYHAPSKTDLIKIRIRSWFDPYVRILERSGGLNNQKLIEVGCSFGTFLKCCIIRGSKVHGVELDAKARKSLTNFGVTTSAEIPSNGTFDIACAFQVLEHIANPLMLLNSIHSILQKDGRLLLSVPNAGEVSKLGCAWVGFRADLEHFNYFDLKSLSHLLTKSGFYIEQYWEHHQPNLQRTPGSSTFRITDILTLPLYLLRYANSDFSENGAYALTVLARKV